MTSILRIGLAVVLLAVGGCAAGQPEIMSGQEFAAVYADALQDAAPGSEVRVVGPLELSVERGDDSFTVFLDNAYTSYRSDPGRLQAVIDDYVIGILEADRGDTTIVDVSRIVPVIKGPAFLDTFREIGWGDGSTTQLPAFDRYSDDLIILYAEDAPRSLRFLFEDHLAEAEVSRDARLGLAVENLRSLLPDLGTYEDQGIHGLVADGIYEASLLLFDELWGAEGWTRRTLGLVGEPVVAVPTRNLLLVVDSQDPGSVALLRELAFSMHAKEPYPVARQLFVYRGGRFQPFGG